MDINKLFIKLKKNKKMSKNSYTILYYRYYNHTNSGKEDPYKGAID